MLDFTSARYLGFRHPSRSLRPWSQLTTGKPAALETPSEVAIFARRLADLQGCECATFMPSTLHLFFDLFEVLRKQEVIFYIDAATYPIVRAGAERAATRGALLREIPHHDPIAAYRMIEADEDAGLRPVIVADGFCPICNRSIPLQGYLECVAPFNGWVVVDDTQAIGIWGHAPSPRDPYGRGGGGSLRLHALQSPRVILGSSLAKGFGVPLAVLSGSASLIRCFEVLSEMRVHASPPSIAALRAAEHALLINQECGDRRRRRLAGLVSRFRSNLHGLGLDRLGSLFPVQMPALEGGMDPVRVQRTLLAAGVRTLLVQDHAGPKARLAFILNASQRPESIDKATTALAAGLSSSSSG